MIQIIWLCIVCINIAHCSSAMFLFQSTILLRSYLYILCLARTFILPLSILYLMNLWIFCKIRSTSLILPESDLFQLNSRTTLRHLSRHLNSCYHYPLNFQQGEGYCVCVYCYLYNYMYVKNCKYILCSHHSS